MRREGSALNGVGVVLLKELSDHLTSVLMRVCEVLIVLLAFAALYFTIQQVKETTAEDQFLFLRLFTRASEGIPITFVLLLSWFFVPILAIVLGFDAVSSEHNRRTLSRILAQPIYRDALLFGKFVAGLLTISFSLVALWLLVIGLGLLRLGVPPNAEETARAFIFLLVTIAYAGVWLALAMLSSIIFRSAATAAFVAFGLWLLLTFLWPWFLAPMVANVVAPLDPGYTALGLPTPENIEWIKILSRLSPSTLYNEIALVLLNPDDVSARSLGTIYLTQLQGAARGALPLGQSLIIAWPDIVALVAGTIVLFTIGYTAFQRQEVRA